MIQTLEIELINKQWTSPLWLTLIIIKLVFHWNTNTFLHKGTWNLCTMFPKYVKSKKGNYLDKIFGMIIFHVDSYSSNWTISGMFLPWKKLSSNFLKQIAGINFGLVIKVAWGGICLECRVRDNRPGRNRNRCTEWWVIFHSEVSESLPYFWKQKFTSIYIYSDIKYFRVLIKP